MNLVHVVPSLGQNCGGPSRSVSSLCRALCKSEKHKIKILTAHYANDPPVEVDPEIDLTLLHGHPRIFGVGTINAGFGDALSTICTKESISLVHQHGIWQKCSNETTNYAYKNKIPLVVSPRGMLEPWAINNSKWKKKLAWRIYQKSDLQKPIAFHATAVSEAENIRRLGLNQPIAVIPNGVEIPQLKRQKTGGRDQSLERNGQRKTALFLSRINPKKGLLMLLDAWNSVASEDWRLVIAGNDDSNHLPEVEQRIQDLGLSENVEVVGPLFGEAKEDAFSKADLFVLPSYSENFGIVVAEALGYQIPVLTTTGCPWKELQTHRCGWWVEPNLEGVQSGLQQALSCDADELYAMGLRGRPLVEEKYQWPTIAESMAGFYEWLINNGKKPTFVI